MTRERTILTIDHVGHRGDGIANGPDGPVYVPFTLAGEQVAVRLSGDRAELLEIIEPSPERSEPPCPHFGACGGCALQHMADDAYRAWKRQQVVAALHQRGLMADVEPLHPALPGSRRRAVLTAKRAGRKLAIGYHGRQSHAVVDITTCPVLTPAIVAALPALRRVAEIATPGRGALKLTVLASESGLDVALANATRLTARDEQRLIALAMESGFARLTVDGETLIAAMQPRLSFGGAGVVPPPGGFTQASAAAETAMASLAEAATVGATRVADLFSGVGTFTLRLARHAAVHAVESDRAAIAALEHGIRYANGLKPVTTERRDLFDYPLMPKELSAFDAVVFDPPRAGARRQAEELARSNVATVVAVSCNPATLARDLKILVEGGYTLRRVTPVDQFLWSPHIECVAVLARDTA